MLWCCLAFAVCYALLTKISLGNYGLFLFGLLFLLGVVKKTAPLDSTARKHIIALLLLLVVAIFYKAMFFETFFVVNVFTDRIVDRMLFGVEIPATTFLALGGIFTILLGPLWAYLWQSKKIKCSVPLKFALSLLLMGACLQLLAWVTTDTNTLIPVIWIFLFRLIFTISELFILPIGLAMVAEYAPKNSIGMMMGAWYMSAAFGGKLSGILAKYAAVPNGTLPLQSLNNIYHHAFQLYAGFCFLVFLVCLLSAPFMQILLKK